jgi:hypothetical protein
MVLRALSQLGRRGRTRREFFAVLGVWSALSLISIFPTIFVDKIALFLGIRSGINALFFFLFVVLFYVVGKLLISHEEAQEKITGLTREIALSNFRSEQNLPFDTRQHRPLTQNPAEASTQENVSRLTHTA